MSTPNVALDLEARIVELRPSDFDNAGDDRDIWARNEQPVGGVYRQRATFVRRVTERRQLHGDGQVRFIDVQILHRFPRGDAELDAADARMRALYDALHLSGGFVGADSGATYHDVRAIDGPTLITEGYITLNVTLWLEA